jgi:hemolysin activation/secretion protein
MLRYFTIRKALSSAVSGSTTDLFAGRGYNAGCAAPSLLAHTLIYVLSLAAMAGGCMHDALAQQAGAPSNNNVPATITINEYAIKGNHLLSEIDIDNAVYPYLGPGQTVQSVDAARDALQKAYAAKGYETVAVEIPPQHVIGGVILFQVVEAPVGRLHVKGSRYFSLNKIKEQAPSLAPGQVPNFKRIKHDIIALNQWPDRQIIPTLLPGTRPQTVDVDLNVKDTLPLHGSLSLDNRYSPDTTPLRIDGSVSYDNLWQRGDTINMAFQVAPQRPNDALVFTGSYLARVPNNDWLTFLFYGLVSNSKVSTVGSTNVVGRGHVLGIRAITDLAGGDGFYDTLSSGIDYKEFDQDVSLAGATLPSPVTYYPITASYSANWQGDHAETQFDIGPTLSIRGLGSSPSEFDTKRYKAESNFIYVRGDLSRQQDLPGAFQIYVKAQGQVSNQSLVNSEQFSLGGQDTVRGYLESEVLADEAIAGSVEIRSPPLEQYLGPDVNSWRVFLFTDCGWGAIVDPLPDQQPNFTLLSAGAGTRLQLIDHLNGMVDLAVPLHSSVTTKAEQVRVEFKVWVQF